MFTTRHRVVALAALGVFALSACADSPNAPRTDATLRTVAIMEGMAAQAARAGDVATGNEFTFVAGALRQGVRPSRFEAFTGTRWEAYDALVRVEQHMGPEPSTHNRFDRFFFAWQAMGEDGLHLLKVRTTGEHGDMDVNPEDPGAANYLERAGDIGTWNAFEGMANIVEGPVLGKCEPAHLLPAGGHMVACYRARYLVNFEIRFQPTHEVDAASHWMLMWARPQMVNAVKWVLNEPE